MPTLTTDRRVTTLTLDLDAALVAEARALGIDLDAVVEAGLRAATEEAQTWQRENAAAIRSSNDWVERNGLPLARYRQF